MKTGQPFSRREFLKTTGEALSLFTVAVHLPSPIANAAEGGSKRFKREAPNIRRLLDEMDSKGSQF